MGPLNIERYKTIINDLSGMRRYCGNIFQWRKIKTKSTNSTQWRLLKYLFRTFLVQLLDAIGSRGLSFPFGTGLGVLPWLDGGWLVYNPRTKGV